MIIAMFQGNHNACFYVAFSTLRTLSKLYVRQFSITTCVLTFQKKNEYIQTNKLFDLILYEKILKNYLNKEIIYLCMYV